jgi:hypothetical protein
MPYGAPCRILRFGRASLVGILSLIAPLQAFAAGSNTTSTAPTPATPPSVVTSQPQAALIGDATGSDTVGIVAQGIAAGTDIAGLGAEIAAQAAGVGPTQQAAEAAALGIQVVSKTASAVAYGAQVQQTMLPSCEQTFTGTVTVTNGGVNVTGGSIFNGNVGVVGSLNASQNVTASQVHAIQGISADGGAIWLGDPNGTTYSSGITLGGGALSGAGTGGLQAFRRRQLDCDRQWRKGLQCE